MILAENHKKRIMVIEDDAEMRSLLKDFFKEDGYAVSLAGNGAEAFKKLHKETYDLIITDIRLPGWTGLDILPGIRKLQPKIPLIVITAFGSEEIYSRAVEKGATAYLEKPICFNKLGVLIHEMIGAKK